ncbi:MAG: hypothetical protein Q8P26_02270 [Candidatus Levybacteria bacterium]|nr:hypothetical protein [Candidatus Levybacteria bacterium]
MEKENLAIGEKRLIRPTVNVGSNGQGSPGEAKPESRGDIFRKAMRGAAFPPPDKK